MPVRRRPRLSKIEGPALGNQVRPHLEFWYEFASTYSYLTVSRIEDVTNAAGIELRWRPFLLGPIFAAQGWNTSPFSIYEVKGRYMWRDVARRARHHGLPFQRPDLFPQNGLLAARLALVGVHEGWCGDFSRLVYRAQFVEGEDISDQAVLAAILRDVGVPEGPALAAALSDWNKALLRAQTEDAAALGIFGAPSFIVNGELFWGDDRLEDAVACLLAGAVAP